MKTENLEKRISGLNDSSVSISGGRFRTLTYFIVTLLGFSFWFFMAVPFASHRETYWWLAMSTTHDFGTAFSVISVTYRPVAQAATWLAFLLLKPNVFPTSIVGQAFFQGLVYGLFALAWWFIYRAAFERRIFALVAFVAGGVFFPGYVHLFHIYGMMYVPVMLTIGGVLWLYASNQFEKRELLFAGIAMLLALWHPFATALFVGFYFGFYLETFRERRGRQHLQAILVMIVGLATIALVAFLFPRADAKMSIDTRLFGFLVTYRTNEVNAVSSLVALLLSQVVVFSMAFSSKLKAIVSILVLALSAIFFVKSIPVLFVWMLVVLMKLLYLRRWGLFFLTLTAALLPFGGGIGAPVFALFAIVVAVYATPLGWSQAENELSFVRTRYVMAAVAATVVIIVMIRAGIKLPVVTKAASPLLAEREKTYQLEHILAWLHKSDYCGYDLKFADNANSPTDSIENVLMRKNRPPAAFEDVQLYWNSVLQCQRDNRDSKMETATVTFGSAELANAKPVFHVSGRYSGEAAVWVQDIPSPSMSARVSINK